MSLGCSGASVFNPRSGQPTKPAGHSGSPTGQPRLFKRLRVTLMVLVCGAAAMPAALAGAQTNASNEVRGSVLDPSGGALKGAEINFVSPSFQARAAADDQGAFRISVTVASGLLEISAPGFNTSHQEWHSGDGDLAIILTPKGPLERVTVTANRAPSRLSETSAIVTVLDAERLDATASLAIDDQLRQVPGFSLLRRTSSRVANPTTQGVSLRGLGASGASRALVLADGVPLNDPFGGWVYWDRIPRAGVGSVEVASGGASYLYGSNAMGGVIQIFRKPLEFDQLSLEASGGNESTGDLSVFASKKIGQWAVGGGLELFHTGGYVAVAPEEQGAVDTPVASEYATAEFAVSRKFREDDHAFVRGMLLGESRKNGTPLQTNSTTIREIDVGSDLDTGRIGMFRLRGYASSQILDQTFSAISGDRNDESLTRAQRVPAQRLGFSAQWSKAAGTRHNLVAGLEQWTIHGDTDETRFSGGIPAGVAESGGRELTWAAYGQDAIRLTSSWLLIVSGRFDHWRDYSAFTEGVPIADRSENFFSPRLTILKRLNGNVSLTASGYRSFRAPTLNELYRGFRAGNVVTIANPDLRAERLTGVEGGMIVTGWSERVLLRGTFFWNEITQSIANVTIAQNPTVITRQRENLGRTRSRGVEFQASENITKTLSITAGYQYTDATVTSFPADPTLNTSLVGLDIPQVPRNQLTFQIAYAGPRISLSAQGRFIGEQFDDDLNQFLLRRFFALDVMGSFSLRRGVELFGAVENATDIRYDVGRTPVLTVGPPILVRAGVRLRFGNGSN